MRSDAQHDGEHEWVADFPIVTMQSGPFTFLPDEPSRKVRKALDYAKRASPHRITDKQIYDIVDPSKLIEKTHPGGTVLFVDSSQCLHYGSRDAVAPRYLMMYAYVSLCRTDFGDLLRKESPSSVQDDPARLHRARHLIKDGKSTLQRLILDRQCLS